MCTSSQTHNHASIPPLSFLQAGCPSCCPTNRVNALLRSILYAKSCLNTGSHVKHSNKKSQSNLGRATSPPIIAREQLHHKVPIGYIRMFHIYLHNCPFLFDDLHPHLIHPSPERPHSPPQTASRSNQPFCHNSPTKPKD